MRFGISQSIVAVFFIWVAAAQAQETKLADGFKVMDHFVGNWRTEVNDKPSKFVPNGGKFIDLESTSRTLKGRFILGRQIRQGGGEKSLWLMTYDPKGDSYPFWFFSSGGVLGGEWSGKWDEQSRTWSARATDTPAGWTSGGGNQFPDEKTVKVTVWMKDETGAVLLDSTAEKTRQPDANRKAMLASWSESGKPAQPAPPELKVLERLVGSWDAAAVFKPAEWTPKEERSTSKVTRKWVLDGWFLQDTSEISDGSESISLLGYDAGQKKYRGWWFNSEGHRNKSFGDWDEASGTLSFRADLEDGLVSTSSVKFIDTDHHVWKVEVKDAGGKLFFEGEWTVRRRKD